MGSERVTTFDEYVAWMAVNSPHAAILDSWRRLDRALDEYAAKLGIKRGPRQGHRPLEGAITGDQHLGQDVVSRVHELRKLRNRVAHEPGVHISQDEATRYARDVFAILGVLAIAVDAVE